MRSSVSAQTIAPQLTADQLARPVVVTQDGYPDLLRGRIIRLNGDILSVSIDGKQVDVPFARVARIEFAPDSLKNGAVIGALVFGIWCAKVCGQGTGNGAQAFMATMANAGLGALIGAGIDAAHGRRPPIYVRAQARGAHLGFSLRF